MGTHLALATPGGLAADLTILASSLLALAGLLFFAYLLAVVGAVIYGVVRGPLPDAAVDRALSSSAGVDGGR